MKTFKCSGENLPNSSCRFLETQVSFPSNFVSILSAIKHNSSVFFFAQTYNLVKISILTFSSVLMKICQIAHIIFQTTSQFFFKFYMTRQCHEIYSSVFFLGQMLYTWHRGTNQSANVLGFLVLGSKFIKSLSFLKQIISFPSNFVPLFGIMRHNSSMLF